jgi:hypothetical protein
MNYKVVLLATVVSLTVSAQEQTLRDKNIDTLASDLYTLGRVTAVAEDLGRAKPVLLTITDEEIETLRVPRGDGTYQWASLQREEGGRVRDEKSVERVSTEKELRYVTVTGANGYRVEVVVPKKRSTFAANNRVWVRNVIVDSTGFDGKISHHEIPVNAWVNPGDATGVALPEIGKSVKATAELGVESGNKLAVAEVGLVQAKLVDDPASPYFPAVKKLLQVREQISAREINRGALKNTVDEALLALPGELERRTAEQARAAEERTRLAASGQVKGAIALGDATPDVAKELADIARLLTGTLEDQASARARLATLVSTLTPQMAP